MTPRRAFTLIEVLLAVFIIGLGSIGLFALFAGVATQQSNASDLTRAVAQAQGLLGTIEGRVGPLGEWMQDGGDSLSTADDMPSPDRVFGSPLVRGVWYPTFAYYGVFSDPLYDGSLTVNPRAQTGDLRDARYFVTPTTEIEVFSNPAVYQGPNSYQPFIAGTQSLSTFTGGPDSMQFGSGEIARLPGFRAALGTVEIEFWKSNTTTGRESLAFAVTDTELLSTVGDAQLELDAVRVLPPRDTAQTAQPPSVDFNYAAYPPNGLSATAGIDQFSLVDIDSGGNPTPRIGPNEWISSIRIRCGYRADRILSLGERLVTVADDERASGRRAAAGATMLYRLTPTGRSQYVTLAYAITPIDRDGDFVPPERPLGAGSNATNGLLRISDGYQLLYDDDIRNAYYLIWSDEEDTLVEGDILVVGGELSPAVNAQLNRRGADNPVRVTRVINAPGEGPRAYLDDSPRVGGRSMRAHLTAGSGAPLSRVYSLRRRVESLDGSEWDIRPVLFTTLDVR